MIAPDSGRLAVRSFSSGASAVVGVLHLPQQFVPQEGASYLMWLSENGIALEPHKVGEPLPDMYACSGINATLTGNFWHKTNQPGTLTVRFTAAFPEENGWTVYGAANQPLFGPERFSTTGHVWCDVKGGRVDQIDAPIRDTGMTAGQLVRDYVVWPNRQGVLHTLPDIESGWRQAYVDHAMLQARFGAGEITRSEMTDLVRADPKLFEIRSLSVDEHYCKYLARLREAGGIEIARPLTAEENQEKGLRAAKLVRLMVDEEELPASVRAGSRPA